MKPTDIKTGQTDLVAVLLDCGHQITVRNFPMNPNVKYSCPEKNPEGGPCGYNVGWRSFRRGRLPVKENPLYSTPDSPRSGVVTVGPKGRVIVPAAIRRAAGLVEGTKVTVKYVGKGQVTVEASDE